MCIFIKRALIKTLEAVVHHEKTKNAVDRPTIPGKLDYYIPAKKTSSYDEFN